MAFISAMNVLWLFLWGLLLPPLGSVRSAAANEAPNFETSARVDDKCWVFLHLPKSGGTTMKRILRKRFARRYAVYTSDQWKEGGGFKNSIAHALASGGKLEMVAGGYAEAFRNSSAVGQTCKWFTVFRHPITRLVSAYYFCKTKPSDQLCATSILRADQTDLTTFAKHWGNFAMRQFILDLVPVDDVLEYSRTDAFRDRLPPNMKNVASIPGWYLVKMYLDDQAGGSEPEQIPDAAMYEMMQPVQDLLRDSYTVGILEKFNASLSLFDAALGMPGADWHKQYARIGQQNIDNSYLVETEASLAEAWTSSEIKQYMQLDLVLYEHAVDVFHKQTQAYGIEA